ncbi:unnamed protein product [marine sediment metagenome]|uniref:Uncharacterized protein n=1 Tax=marine sediment metagenome TaxID=412755 RepID=X1IUV0_9ZZZZ
MGKLERCFVCAVMLVPGRGATVEVRTDVVQWTPKLVCPRCARKLKDIDEALVVKDGEWWTVRLGVIEKET